MNETVFSSQHNQLPALSVTDISQQLKSVVEQNFSHVRVRGEISGFKRAASGHLYFSLKDQDAVMSAVCWKGKAAQLAFAPEDGIEVIVSGKISTYPGRSNYQIVIDSMEIAGEGALMALLEKRKQMLSAEGLFDASKKKALPFLPRKIGVVTSPTGAVIRDILHRLADRFPTHVMVWPVLVQGEGAKEQIAAAINGFNTMPLHQRPDLLIVARGGGSLEDLWAFNEEVVVRAAAASTIPLISAVGHETDTTLIDYVSDKRAPTPTGAAEMAVPVREELRLNVMDLDKRMVGAKMRSLQEHQKYLHTLSRAIPAPQKMLEYAMLRMDDWSERLSVSLPRLIDQRMQSLAMAAQHFRPKLVHDLVVRAAEKLAEKLALLRQSLPLSYAKKQQKFDGLSERIVPQLLARNVKAASDQLLHRGKLGVLPLLQQLEKREDKLQSLVRLLDSYHYQKVLDRGFVLVRNEENDLQTSAKTAQKANSLSLQFADGTVQAYPGDAPTKRTAKRTTKAKAPKADSQNQGSLF